MRLSILRFFFFNVKLNWDFFFYHCTDRIVECIPNSSAKGFETFQQFLSLLCPGHIHLTAIKDIGPNTEIVAQYPNFTAVFTLVETALQVSVRHYFVFLHVLDVRAALCKALVATMPAMLQRHSSTMYEPRRKAHLSH